MSLLNVRLNDKKKRVSVIRGLDGIYKVTIGRDRFRVVPEKKDANYLLVDESHRLSEISLIRKEKDDYRLLIDGLIMDAAFEEIAEEAVQSSRDDFAEDRILAPMPGVISKVYVRESQQVEEGSKILSLMSMKIENDIMAKKKCRIRKVHVKEKDMVQEGDMLVELE